jgi:hypothetical protein
MAISRLNTALGYQLLVADRHIVSLGKSFCSDREAFLDAVERGDLEAAARIYTGDFFPAFATPGTPAFEHWADRERQHLRATFVRCADSLVRDWLGVARVREAIALARRVRDQELLRQAGWRLLLEAVIASGDRLAAGTVADDLERRFAEEEMALEPSTRSLIKVARHAGVTEEADGDKRGGLVAELVGRETEFAAIVAAWTGAMAGSYAHVHVTAPAGLGKTRLLADIHERLRAMRAQIVYVRGTVGAQKLAATLAGDLAMALATLRGARAISEGAASALVALHPALSSYYPASPDRIDDEDAPRRRAFAIQELITAVADEAPVAILIDDLQWADAASREIFGGALRNLDRHSVLVVSASRPRGAAPCPDGRIAELTLHPLSAADVGAIVASLATLPDSEWAATLPEALHRASGGSPLLVLETLQLALDQGLLERHGNEWRAPDADKLFNSLRTGSALHCRLAEALAEHGRLLTLLAAGGMPLTTDLLARATESVLDDTSERLAMLEQRGLIARAVDNWELAHDEYLAAILDRTPPDDLRAAHTTLGRALFWEVGEDANRMRRAAHHLVSGGEHQLLDSLFVRFVRLARSAGDQRTIRALGRDLLGAASEPAAVAALAGRLPWRLRAGPLQTRWIATAALVLLLLPASFALVLAMTRQPVQPPPDAVIVVAHTDSASGQLLLHDFPLRRSGWQANDVLKLHVRGDPRWRISKSTDWDMGELVQSYPERLWTVSHAVLDSGVRDIFMYSPEGKWRRLTFMRADETEPQWAPDGSQLAFRTGSFHPLRHADIAILDASTGDVRQLTHGNATDHSPRWSPDGTRIAFGRLSWEKGRSEALCVVAVDGSGLRCLHADSLESVVALGWSDDQHVLLAARSSQTWASLAQIDVANGDYTVLDTTQGHRFVSPDGQWIACECQRAGYPEGTWFIHPTNRPQLARQLQVTGVSGSWRLLWARAQPRPHYLDRLRIDVGAGEPIRGIPYQLRASGFDISGVPVPARMLRWRSLDTLVATVDSTGLLFPRREGRVTVQLSAGGWRDTSRTLRIRNLTAHTVLTENWQGELGGQWVPFGQTRPKIVQRTDGAPAFWNGNDGTYTSGVYSKRTFSSSDGLGLEVQLSTPVTLQQWQLQSAGLFFGEPDAFAAWDHRTGYPPLVAASSAGVCSARYPTGHEGSQYGKFVGTSAGMEVIAPPKLRTGRWFTLRLQIFPDGRCGIALDGRPIALGKPQSLGGSTGRVVLHGQSYQTRILVGRVEVFTGVRDDIDWSPLLRSTARTTALDEQ